MIIEFSENNILEAPFFMDILEEVYDDEARIVLNKDQIKSSIGQLVSNKEGQINTFYDLLENKIENVDYIKVPSIIPLVMNNKYRYLVPKKGEATEVIDDEFDNSKFVKKEMFSTYLENFHSVNQVNRANKYTDTARTLYAISKPFTEHEFDTSSNIIHKKTLFTHDCEVIRLEKNLDQDDDYAFDIRRLIGRIDLTLYDDRIHTLYDGDEVDVVGYYNSARKSNLSNYKVFDFDKYFNHLQNLMEDDQVDILFNDFNAEGKTTNGKIDNIDGDKIIIKISKSKHLTYHVKNYNAFYIFKTKDYKKEDQFCKKHLAKSNIMFLFPPEGLVSSPFEQFIYPINASELLYVFGDKTRVYNLHDLDKYCLKPYGLDINELNCQRDVIKSFIKKKLPLRLKFNKRRFVPPNNKWISLLNFKKNDIKKYPSNDTFSDCDLSRMIFIKSKRDFGFSWMLELFKKHSIKAYGKSDLDKLTKYLEEIPTRLKTIKSDIKKSLEASRKSCEIVIAKTYKTLEDLQKDNNKKHIYFDSKHDPTDYSLAQNNDKSSLMTTLKSNPDMSFEVNSIISGKRRVRIGDCAILNADLYERREVDTKGEMWIYKGLYAIVCQQKRECAFDSIDLKCKHIENMRLTRTQNKLLVHQRLITDIIKNAKNLEDKIVSPIDQDIEDYKKYYRVFPNRERSFGDFTYEDDVDYEDEDDDQYNHIDFNDRGNFSILRNDDNDDDTDTQDIEINETESYGDNILATLLQFTEIDFEKPKKNYILTLNKGRNILNDHSEQKKALEAMLKQKGKSLTNKENKNKIDSALRLMDIKFNRKCILSITALVILMIMAFWPSYLIKKILPKCVKLFRYSINKNGHEASLVKYFACVIKNIGSANDTYFGEFINTPAEEIENLLQVEMDYFMDAYTGFYDRIEESKVKIQKDSEKIKSVTSYNVYYGFKPSLQNFDIPDRIKAKDRAILSLIQNMYKAVQDKKDMKHNFALVPLITNSCCQEPLTSDFNYYNFFPDEIKREKEHIKDVAMIKTKIHFSKETKRLQRPAINESKDGNIVIEEFSVVFFNDEERVKDLDVIKQNIETYAVANDTILKELSNKFNDGSWYNTEFNPVLNALSEKLGEDLGRDFKTEFEMIHEKMIEGKTPIQQKADTRQMLINFIKIHIPRFMMRLKNRYVLEDVEETRARVQLYENNQEKCDNLMNTIKELTRNISVLVFNTCDANSLVLKNISFLMYIILRIIEIIVDTKINRIKEIVVKPLMNILVKLIDNNDHEMESLKMNLEELREQMKKEQLDKYSKDRTIRDMQGALKRMGLDHTFQDYDPESQDNNQMIERRLEEEDGELEYEDHGENPDD